MTSARTSGSTWYYRIIALLGSLLVASCPSTPPLPSDHVLISVIGTNDVHGVFLSSPGRGGLTTISGYVTAVRAARDEDGGAVLLIDAGDMWQGTLESNLSEGASMVEAYNAMGYTAAAIGNHEFDFGPLGESTTPQNDDDDARGNLKKRATDMQFPLLAANLVDKSTGQLVNWDNVSPSTMIDAQGIKVGIIGVMTERALITTIGFNVVGLAIQPLVLSISREARLLRDRGAQLVIVAAHAGSRCAFFDDPYDLSSCYMDGEIMRVANALPRGLVDHIIAGHTHQQIAHFVNGISITSSFARTETFSRTDFVVARGTGEILDRDIFTPQVPCPYIRVSDGECAWENGEHVVAASYEKHPVTPDETVLEISMRATTFASDKKNEKLGPYLETPFLLEGNPESPLGNLFTDAILESIEGDIAIHNVTGGIRAPLPDGPLTFGSVYEVFPFDNRVVVLDLSGKEVREIVAAQAHNHRRRAGISGMRVFVDCSNDVMSVRMVLSDGEEIRNSDRIAVIVNDFLVLGGDGVLEPVMPEGGFEYTDDGPLARDVLVEWFRQRQGPMNAADFQSDGSPRWNLPTKLPRSCTLPT